MDSLLSQGKSLLCIGRHQPASVKSENFISFDLENPQPQNSSYQVGTVIFNSALKGRYPQNSPEWHRQGAVTAPHFSHLFKTLNINPARLITIGSSEEYGARTEATPIQEDAALKPLSSYGYWKTELYRSGLNWSALQTSDFIHLRPFNVFGLHQDPNMFLGSIIHQMIQGKTFPMTAGEQYRSFVTLSVVIKTILTLLERPNWNSVQKKNALNVSGHHYYQLKDVAHTIQELIPQGSIHLGAVNYREQEVWHQNPALDLIDSLLGNEIHFDFKQEILKVIKSMSADIK